MQVNPVPVENEEIAQEGLLVSAKVLDSLLSGLVSGSV